MQSKLIRAQGLDQLEEKVNEFLASINDKFHDNKHLTELQKIKIHNVQQFTIGEVKEGVVSLSNQPQVNYFFCLLIFFEVEPLPNEK